MTKNYENIRRNQKALQKVRLLLVAILLSISAGYAQRIAVRGTVTDSGGPIAGVSVLVQGTATGVTTDASGNYTITAASDGQLVFSFLGYKEQIVHVNGRSVIDVVMVDDVAQLEEIVVIGYGTVRKRDLTGSVASMKSDEILLAPTSNVMEALQGRVAGLDIIKTTGQLGAESDEDVQILLRGARSIYGDNAPLFIIDGIPGSYNSINPNDIESVDILKDASSTAIYGSAGSNGVVIITTKRGKEGKTTVNFDAYYGISGKPEYFNGMIGDEWTNYQREAYKYKNGQYPASMSSILLETDKFAAYEDGRWIDWVDEASGRTATMQKYNLSVTGGTEKTQVFSSMSCEKQEGLLRNEDLNRYTLRLNVDQTIFPWAKIGVTSNIVYSLMNQGVSNTYTKALTAFPLGDAYDENGDINYEFASSQYTPLGDFIPYQYVNETRSTDVNLHAYLELTPLAGLSFRTVVNTNLSDSRNGKYWGEQANASLPTYASSPWAEVTNKNGYGYTWENILSYSRDITEDHNIGATLVSSWNKSQDENFVASGGGQDIDSWSFYRLLSAPNQRATSGYDQTQKMSYAIRVNYSFKGKYLLNFSNRWDGVSWLSSGHKWDSFPAAAVAWRVSDEEFMAGTKGWLDNMKLRVGYGVTGNSGGVTAYGTTSTPFGYTKEGITVNGNIASFYQYTGTYGNPGLGWEKSYSWNIGLDISVLRNRIDLSFDWYDTKTKDLLFKRTMPITSGATGWGSPLPSWENIAETANKGLEFVINSRNIIKRDFTWSTALTFSWGKEKIVSLPSGDLINESLFEGYPIKSLYGYKYAGIWGTNESAYFDLYGVKAGWTKIVTVPTVIDEDTGETDNGEHKYSASDRMVLGHSNPDFIVGFNNTFTYKNFDLTIFAMGRFGQTIESDLLGFYNAQTGYSTNQPAGIDYWTESNQGAFYPAPGSGDEESVYIASLRYRDGSFIKVKNITLGYTLPQHISRVVKMEKLRFYATAYNPFIYVKDKELRGTDPETNGSDAFPLYKQFVFGVNITF